MIYKIPKNKSYESDRISYGAVKILFCFRCSQNTSPSENERGGGIFFYYKFEIKEFQPSNL